MSRVNFTARWFPLKTGIYNGPLAAYRGHSYTIPMKLSQSTLEQLITLLKEDDRIASAYLLGSAAKGCMRADSDIDVAILPKQGITVSSLDLAVLAGELSYAVGRQVDVGLLGSNNLVYANQALNSGYRLFAKNQYYVELMETSLISMYLWFTEERKELVNAYQLR